MLKKIISLFTAFAEGGSSGGSNGRGGGSRTEGRRQTEVRDGGSRLSNRTSRTTTAVRNGSSR